MAGSQSRAQKLGLTDQQYREFCSLWSGYARSAEHDRRWLIEILPVANLAELDGQGTIKLAEDILDLILRRMTEFRERLQASTVAEMIKRPPGLVGSGRV